MVTKIWESQDDFNRSLEKAIKGSRIEQGKFKEAITSDQLAPYFWGAAQPVFEDEYADLTLQQIYPSISTVELLNDFRPTALFSLEADTEVLPNDNGGIDRVQGTLPAVPELSPYPTFGWKADGKWIDIPNKGGARIQFSFEAFINDQWSIIEQFPKAAAELATRTEDVAVLSLLFRNGGFNTDNINDANRTVLRAYNDPVVVSNPVVKNSPLNHDALVAAIQQVAMDKRGRGNNRTVTVPNGFVLLVPPALEQVAKLVVNTPVMEVTQGNRKYIVNNTLNASVEIVSSEWVSTLGTDTSWVILPKGGRTSAKRTLLKTGLRGYEAPELRVNNSTGKYLAGGEVPWTEGSFNNDDAEARVRLITGGALVNYDGIVGSTGLGS